MEMHINGGCEPFHYRLLPTSLSASTLLSMLRACTQLYRLKERKAGNHNKAFSTVSEVKRSVGNQSIDTNKTNDEINQPSGSGSGSSIPDIFKKRKLNDVAYIPTLADFPSHKLLDHDKCKKLLNQETFFIDGFTPEVLNKNPLLSYYILVPPT